MNTYEVIKKLCEDRGTNITNLEMELGFSRGSLGKLREGRTIHADRASKIAEYFGVPVDYILTGELSEGFYISPETARMAQELYMNRDLRLLFEAAADADPSDLQLVHQMLKALKAKEQKS